MSNKELPRQFAQTYCLTPEDAFELRANKVECKIPIEHKDAIICALEEIMRQNPYSQAFNNTYCQIKQIEEEQGEIPHFRV